MLAKYISLYSDIVQAIDAIEEFVEGLGLETFKSNDKIVNVISRLYDVESRIKKILKKEFEGGVK